MCCRYVHEVFNVVTLEARFVVSLHPKITGLTLDIVVSFLDLIKGEQCAQDPGSVLVQIGIVVDLSFGDGADAGTSAGGARCSC